MTFYLKEEFLSFDHFDIWDEDGNVKYQVERELFQFGRKLVVVDMQGREVCFVQHIPFSIPCAYELAVPGGSVQLDRPSFRRCRSTAPARLPPYICRADCGTRGYTPAPARP